MQKFRQGLEIWGLQLRTVSSSSLGIFNLSNTADRTYTLPNASGTLALTTDIHAPVTLGTANGLSLSTQQLSLGLASSGITGALSGTDWNTFNGKQAALGFTPINKAGDTGIGSLTSTGTITATQFNGSGAGLTGTAASLTSGSSNALGNYAQDLQTVISNGDYLLIRNQAGGKVSLASPANAATLVQAGASGNWSINAATATNATTAGSLSGWNLISNRLATPGLIDGLTTTDFRTTLFGNAAIGNNISTARWNTTPAPLSGLNPYGTMIAWGASDTQGFLAINYNTAGARIGGGAADQVLWTADLITSANIASQTVTNSSQLGGVAASGYALLSGANFSGNITAPGITIAGASWIANNSAYIDPPATFASTVTANGAINTLGGHVSISGSTNPYVALSDGSYNGYLEIASNNLRLYYASGVALSIDPSGVTTFSGSINGTSATFSGPINSTYAGGFYIGAVSTVPRIQYGTSSSTAFSLLTASNGYADLYTNAINATSLTLDTIITPSRVNAILSHGNSDAQFQIQVQNGSGTAAATEHGWLGMSYGTTSRLSGISFIRGGYANAWMAFTVNNNTTALTLNNDSSATFAGNVYTPYIRTNNYTTAPILGNWNGSNYWGFGNDNVNHKVRIGMVDAVGNWQATPGDMSLQVDGSISLDKSDNQITLYGNLHGASSQRAYFSFSDTGTNSLDITTAYPADGNLIRFNPGGVTVLTLDHSKAATFAGNVSSSGAIYSRSNNSAGAAYQLNAITMGYDNSSIRGWIQSGGASATSDLDIQKQGGDTYFGGSITSVGSVKAYRIRTDNGGGGSVWIKDAGSPIWGAKIYHCADVGSTQGAIRVGSAYNTLAGYSNYLIDYATNSQAYNSDPETLTYSNALTIFGDTGRATFSNTVTASQFIASSPYGQFNTINSNTGDGGAGANNLTSSCFFRDNNTQFGCLGISVTHPQSSGYALQIVSTGYDSGGDIQARWKTAGTWGSPITLLTSLNFIAGTNYLTPNGSGAGLTGTAASLTAGAVTINYNNDSNSNYQMLWGSGNGIYGTGGIYCNPYTDIIYASDFSAYSDIRLKENIIPLNSVMDRINQLQIVNFNWNELSGRKSNHTQIGFLAQNVQSLFPEVVSHDGDYLSISYIQMVPVLAKGLTEHEKEIQDFKYRIEELEKKLK